MYAMTVYFREMALTVITVAAHVALAAVSTRVPRTQLAAAVRRLVPCRTTTKTSAEANMSDLH